MVQPCAGGDRRHGWRDTPFRTALGPPIRADQVCVLFFDAWLDIEVQGGKGVCVLAALVLDAGNVSCRGESCWRWRRVRASENALTSLVEMIAFHPVPVADRILVRGGDLVEVDVALFGDLPVADNGDATAATYVSDHRGVLAVFAFDHRDVSLSLRRAEALAWRQRIHLDRSGVVKVPKAAGNKAAQQQPQQAPPALVLARPAVVSSTLDAYRGNLAGYAFDRRADTFFWSDRGPVAGDTFTVDLAEPLGTSLAAVGLYLGTPDGRDCLECGCLSVRVHQEGGGPASGEWTQVGCLSPDVCGKVQTINVGQAAVAGIRIEACAEQEAWMVIREVELITGEGGP